MSPLFIIGRRFLAKVDPFIIPLFVISPFGVVPLAVPGYITNDDSGLHLNRLIAFDQALRQGDLYPRWFPEIALGYGYPELNFYPPLAYSIAEFFNLLGLGFYDAEKFTLAISLIVSGFAMYLWIKDAFGSRSAGFLAAVGYMYFPYRMTDIYSRGALAECVALMFPRFGLFRESCGSNRWATFEWCLPNLFLVAGRGHCG